MSAKRSVLQSKHDFNSCIIGMVLGDSALAHYKNTSMNTSHKLASRDYLEWKRDLLRAYLSPMKPLHEYDNGGYPAVSWYVPATHKLNFLYADLYPADRKIVNIHVLRRLTDLGLAIWFMDDGCLVHQKADNGCIKARPFHLSTDNFGYQGNLLIRDWFAERYQIEVRVLRSKNSWYIWGNTRNTHKLLDIVTRYVNEVPSMHYKVDMMYKRGPYLNMQTVYRLHPKWMIR